MGSSFTSVVEENLYIIYFELLRASLLHDDKHRPSYYIFIVFKLKKPIKLRGTLWYEHELPVRKITYRIPRQVVLKIFVVKKRYVNIHTTASLMCMCLYEVSESEIWYLLYNTVENKLQFFIRSTRRHYRVWPADAWWGQSLQTRADCFIYSHITAHKTDTESSVSRDSPVSNFCQFI